MNKHMRRNISVIGLGYVGLPVAVAFSQISPTIGFDISQKRIDELKHGIDKTGAVNATALNAAPIHFTSNLKALTTADFHIIAVPSPIDDDKKPDLTALRSASKTLGTVLKKGDIVVYESTVYPGVTEEECVPLLEETSGLKCSSDFFIAYSPERINPGDKKHEFKNIKKVVAAQDENTLDIVANVYSAVVDAGVFKAASIKVAEAAKVIENTQRDLNIALMNELAILFKKMDIDTHDVLQAAGTKWNFLSFEPGLVGGHCVGVDPYYLTHKSEALDYTPQVILAGRKINDNMGKYIAYSLIENLQLIDEPLDNMVITILGIAFKENVSDIRNTRVVDIINELGNFPVTIQVHDPCVDSVDVRSTYQIELTNPDNLQKADAVILAVPHDSFVRQGWKLISALTHPTGGLVFDIKSILDRKRKPDNMALVRL